MIELQKKNAHITFTTPSVIGGEGGYVDLSNYYTRDEVDQAIAAIPEVDLSDYYDKNEVDTKIEEIELTPGPAGKDGYTPVKGVDYFDGVDGKDYVLTYADKQEIAGMIDVPSGGGGNGESKSYYIANVNNLTDADIAMLNKWNDNPPYDWHISTGLGIVSKVYKNMVYSGRIEYTIDNGEYIYEYFHRGNDRYMSYIRGISLATTSYVQEAIANVSSGGGSGWYYTRDIYDGNLYNAKEIFIICMDSNNGYTIFSYVVFDEGDFLGNHAWGDYYTFSVASGAEAAYWQYDGSSVNLHQTHGDVLIAYK